MNLLVIFVLKLKHFSEETQQRLLLLVYDSLHHYLFMQQDARWEMGWINTLEFLNGYQSLLPV